MAKRKSTGKRQRFEIFKRDGFTCQYCGAQPPEAVLVIDHIIPVAKGGDNDPMNLVTACEICNQGKADKELGNVISHPDADLEWLAMQQEIKELERYQLARNKKEQLIVEISFDLANEFIFHSGVNYDVNRLAADVMKMLGKYSPELVHDALIVTAQKVSGEYVYKYDYKPYVYGVLRNMDAERELETSNGKTPEYF